MRRRPCSSCSAPRAERTGGDGKKTLPRTIVTAAAVLVLVGALGFGSVYQLQEDEYAVITTFGKPSVVSTSGLKFKIPIIQQKTIVSKATQGFALGYDLRTNVNNEDESLMISVDFNFVNVDFYVEYRVDDPVKYLYNSEEPEAILKMLCRATSAIRSAFTAWTISSRPARRRSRASSATRSAPVSSRRISVSCS